MPPKRLQTARQPPVYANSSPDHRACNSLAPFRCPRAVHPCPSVDSGLDIAIFKTAPTLQATICGCSTSPSPEVRVWRELRKRLWASGEGSSAEAVVAEPRGSY